MASSQWSLVGEGEIFIGPRSGGPLRAVGQVKEFKIDVSEETKEMKNYQGGGGLADQVSWISKIDASLNFLSLSAKNLAMAMRGEITALVAGAVTKAHTAYAGGFLPLEGIGPRAVTVTVDPPAWSDTTAKVIGDIVKPTAGTHFYKATAAGNTGGTEPASWPTDGSTVTDGTVTWMDMGTMLLVAGNFETKSAGIFIPEDSAKIAVTGTPVEVSYTKTAGTIIQALVNAAGEYRVFFSGTNLAREGQPLAVDLYRVKFSPPKDLSFIGDDFAGLTLTGSVLKDDTRSGFKISSFCAIKMAEE
ncbi:MAG: hypothetical protein HQL07_00420 [Nitrospirae bacterium]|nr:hypothetical protein [Magnetococcales bacterium]